MKAKFVKGKDLMLFIGNAAIALASSHKLGIKADTTEASSKDDGIWDDSMVTKMSWEISAEALYSADAGVNSYDKLYEEMIKGEPIDVISGVPANKAAEMPDGGWQVPADTQVYYKGKALITSLDVDASKDGAAKMTASLKGVGKLEKHTPT